MIDLPLSEVGNHFFLGLQPVPRLSDKDKYLLDAVRPAGVVLFKSNFVQNADYDQWLESHRSLIDEIRNACGRDRLFIGVDHEGARVCRTPAPITRFRSASQWAPQAREVGAAMGLELSSLGFNLNFAPVLDVHTNPSNPVIGPRSFGSDPDLVSKSGTAFVDGIQSKQVWACAKHFPGHGDTDADSHYDLPVVHHGLEKLRSRELKPFIVAIEHGIRMVMTSHILLPSIDDDCPATLSRTIVSDILRGELGFGGVVTSDDTGMHAMDRYFEAPMAGRQFLESGHDMLMICAHFTDTARILQLAQAMTEALTDRQFRETVHEPSSERVEKMLENTTMHEVKPLDASLFAKHAQIAGVFGDDTGEVM